MPDTIQIIQQVSTITILSGGPQGVNGVGLPAGGTTGQVPAKIDGDDYNIQWVTNSASVATLNAITNVTITSAQTNDLLQWNGSAWVNITVASLGFAGTLDGLTDTDITGPTDNDVLTWNGTDWVDETLAEAGISAVGHTHVIDDVTGLQGELDARPIIVGGEFGPAVTFDSLSDVTITTVISGHIAQHNGTVWINRTLAAAGVSELGHTHTESEITDLQSYLLDITAEALSTLSDVTITAIGTGEVLKWNGSAWINNTLAEAGISATGHTHTLSEITDSGTAAAAATGDFATAASQVPAGGANEFVLAKASASDHDMEWVAQSGGGSTTVDALTDTIITAVGSGEVLVWNGTADWINQTLAEAGISATGHAHTESDISDLQSYLLDITAEALSTLSDVTITAIGSGEILKWNGSAWINQTLAESGIAAASHVHAGTDITSGEIDEARLPTLIGDSGSGGTQGAAPAPGTGDAAAGKYLKADGVWTTPPGSAVTLESMTDTIITAVGSGEVLVWNGTADWINQTLAEAGISATGHAHTESDISDLQSYLLDITGEALSTLSDATITAIGTGEILKWNGSAWINQTLAESGIAAASHVHAGADITTGTVAAARMALMVGDSGSGGTQGVVPAPGTGDAAAGKYLDADGTWTVPPDTVAPVPNLIKAITIEDPTSSEDLSMFFTDTAITISQMVAVLLGSSTPSVTWTIKHATDRSAAGTAVVTAATVTTSTTTGSVVTSFDDATIPADSFVWLETTAQSGTVTQLNVSLKYTED